MPVMHESEGIVLFHPHVPERAIEGVTEVLHSRWIGQGPKVAQFEKSLPNGLPGQALLLQLVLVPMLCTWRIFWPALNQATR